MAASEPTPSPAIKSPFLFRLKNPGALSGCGYYNGLALTSRVSTLPEKGTWPPDGGGGGGGRGAEIRALFPTFFHIVRLKLGPKICLLVHIL